MTPARNPDQPSPATRRVYGLCVLALYVSVALLRWDLVVGQIDLGRWILAEGGLAVIQVAVYTALFFGLLAFVVWVIVSRASPREDLAMFAFALLAGWAVEAWGTRTGVWSYYTGETPPAWIVPAWPLGALVIDRVSRTLRGAIVRRPTGRAPGTLSTRVYRTLAIVTVVFCIAFARPAWGSVSTWTVLAGIIAAFVVRPCPERDVWVLVTGLACVFLADMWGTGSGCYHYYVETGGAAAGRALGVVYGMLFDTAVVLAVHRLVGLLPPSPRPR